MSSRIENLITNVAIEYVHSLKDWHNSGDCVFTPEFCGEMAKDKLFLYLRRAPNVAEKEMCYKVAYEYAQKILEQKMKAKFYTYRNLNCGQAFSTKHKGLVVERFETARLTDVELRVSAAGNARARKVKKRNVHAFVVSDNVPQQCKRVDTSNLKQIKYNPFLSDSFLIDGEPVLEAKEVIFQDGRLFLIKS